VLDCGLFHFLTGAGRAACTASLRSALTPGGRYLMLGGWGPHPLTPGAITAGFTAGWRVDSVAPAWVEVTIGPGSLPAWLAAVTRT
jgi:hypothetical protein